jgi:acyl-CoA synthetase (AMP-forming)/AMP-acid ligase II
MAPGIEACRTLVDLLRARAEREPERAHLTFLERGVRVGSLTFGQLDARARAIMARLRQRVPEGGRALLVYPRDCEDFITAFYGCLYAGVIAVPVSPPRGKHGAGLLLSIARNARADVALTTGADVADLAAVTQQHGIEALATSGLGTTSGSDLEPPPRAPESIAFLQYTSGSTSAPKGVRVTHANLVANQRAIVAALRTGADTVSVSWLPLFHDMGLIGGPLHALYVGCRMFVMPPGDFLRRPMVWLETISRERGSLAVAPNFAYELLVRKSTIQERSAIDLRSVRVALNGSEPVRVETMTRFCEAFAPAGFRTEAFYPSYGLAEATLLVAGGDPDASPVTLAADRGALGRGRFSSGGTVTLASSGRAQTDHEVRIVDPSTSRTCAPEVVGEIWVSGPSVADGYWDQPEATTETFRARMADEPAAGPFLRTGDLGFLRDRELFVVGRAKDLIIVHGQNVWPQDLERTVEGSHPAVRPGGCAAFAIEAGGEERVAVAAEVADGLATKGEHARIAWTVRRAIAEEHDLPVDMVYLMPERSVPKTSSGKVRRGHCRQELLEGGLVPLATFAFECLAGSAAAEAPRDLLELRLKLLAEAALRLGPIGVEDDFFALGGTSLEVVTLLAEVSREIGVHVPASALHDTRTVAALADFLRPSAFAHRWPHARVGAVGFGGLHAPVYCFDDGSTTMHDARTLATTLLGERPVFGIRVVDPHVRRLDELAELCVKEILEIQPRGPYLLCGRRLGSLAATAVCNALEQRGERVELLVTIRREPRRWRASGLAQRIWQAASRPRDAFGRIAIELDASRNPPPAWTGPRVDVAHASEAARALRATCDHP